MSKPRRQVPPLITPLLPSMYEAQDLVAWIKQNSESRGSGLDDRQQNAVRTYLRFPTRERPKEEFLGELFLIFDDLFFFGSLKNQCSVKYSQKEVSCKEGGTIGVTYHTLITRRPTIKIYKFEPSKNYMDNYWMYASTLLHEMIHAFFDEIEGRTEHGFAWQDIAYALETTANDPKFVGMRLDLDRLKALKGELRLWYKSVVDLTRWGFDPADSDKKAVVSCAKK